MCFNYILIHLFLQGKIFLHFELYKIENINIISNYIHCTINIKRILYLLVLSHDRLCLTNVHHNKITFSRTHLMSLA
jgi:hypothetical protein